MINLNDEVKRSSSNINGENLKNGKKQKIIVIMRHGERSDLAGTEVKLNMSDPELTEIGKSQAYTAGKRLREILEEMFAEDHPHHQNQKDKSIFSLDSRKIALISSPFSRTLETSIYAKNGMNLNLPIYIENGLSEFISKGWFTNSPKNFLSYYQLLRNFDYSVEESQKIKIDKPEYFLNSMMNEILIHQPVHTLPEFPESTNSCISRFHVVLDMLIYYYLIRKEYDILVLVTHVFGLQALCEKMEIPMDYFEIEYCSTFIFKYDPDNGKFSFEKNFYPIIY
jgi:broad specificity phosphatase PhoE